MTFSRLPFRYLTVFLLVGILSACEDYNDLDLQSPGGDANFSSFVAVGNSLTAGFQNNALYVTAQSYSYPSLVASQIETVQDFEQPLISNPGIGGRLGLNGETLSNPTPAEEQGTPINEDLDRPYNNLGVPGAVLADFLGQDLPGFSYNARRESNPFFNIVLGNDQSWHDNQNWGYTQAEQMAALNPSFVLFGLGNNDVLGYVISGGTRPFTPAATFEQLYAASMQRINETGADAMVYTIPDVTSLPFVFLTNAQLLQQGTIIINQAGGYSLVTEQGAVPIWIETADPGGTGTVVEEMNAPNPAASQPGDYFILPASSQLSQLFSQGVGLSSSNPIPNNLVLDDVEMRQAMSLVGQYNAIIEGQAASNGFGVVDFNGIFADIIETYRTTGNGYQANGLNLLPVPGELFSFDGVHPSNRGHGVMANATIEAINSTYNTNIQLIDISTIPQGIPVNN